MKNPEARASCNECDANAEGATDMVEFAIKGHKRRTGHEFTMEIFR